VSLEGKIALVTGASRGIGREIAATLAGAGAKVILASRSAESVRREADAIGGGAEGVALDVADPASVETAVRGILDRHGAIDILVNNAGVTRDGLILRMKPEDWDAVMATNLRGAFLVCRHTAPAMVRKRWGRVINIGSVVGMMGNAGQVNYAASKAGLVGFTKSLARELASRGITVNAVAPGYIETEMTAGLPEEAKKRLFELIPLARLGAPADVAAAVLFLASEAAGYITGQVLNVNGGMYM
jgi:3-oxoacyl-[acyl-carrier protein] reductase